ncbi:hypothetical protein PAECIP111893_03458 [Paenibacillus plantiphilus]|uniref:Uncharacterized protein n=1 Tax=Paenibacillus plantiphilus TaxID=2905650 RepID=A0ABM9CGE1_9BACL|nr:hypothetical protein [Paenibacillus plantiphilus]CAH1211693.1 hypothetical protein PAECIP111893_03458 [Paenibacillus plantiphilus]
MSVRTQLDRIVHLLESRQPLPELRPDKVWNAALDEEITALDSLPGASSTAMIALKAGLHLCNDSLDRSHSYSQEIEDDAAGCYWHGLMHRMEGDYSNSKYWFYQAGSHPAMHSIGPKAAEWISRGIDGIAAAHQDRMIELLREMQHQHVWNSGLLTDAIELQESGRAAESTRGVLQYLQRHELIELLAYSRTAANG